MGTSLPTEQHDIEVVATTVSLPTYPYSHVFLRDGKHRSMPMSVHMRHSVTLPDSGGVINEVMQGIDENTPDVYYLLSNTLVTHWKPVSNPSEDDVFVMLGLTCWVALLPFKNYAKAADKPYVPPFVIGWRKIARVDALITGGVTNKNCFAQKPMLHALRVTLKKQKGPLLGRQLGMMQLAAQIHLDAFDASDLAEKPDWVTTPILLGKFRVDKKRHLTSATWLMFPQRVAHVKAALERVTAEAVDVTGESDY